MAATKKNSILTILIVAFVVLAGSAVLLRFTEGFQNAPSMTGMPNMGSTTSTNMGGPKLSPKQKEQIVVNLGRLSTALGNVMRSNSGLNIVSTQFNMAMGQLPREAMANAQFRSEVMNIQNLFRQSLQSKTGVSKIKETVDRLITRVKTM